MKKKPRLGSYGPLSINLQSLSGTLSELMIEQDASFSFTFPAEQLNPYLVTHPLCYFKSSPVWQQGGQAVYPSQPRDVWEQT